MIRTTAKNGLALAALLTLVGAASCSFMYEYDLEGKPCGNNNTCLPGFVCSKTEGCVRPDASDGIRRDGGAGLDAAGLDASEPPDAEEPPDA